jgi:excisionase family DNA binding protein
MTTPVLIDAEGAADLLGVNRTWIMDAARRGQIPHVKIGRYTRFFEGDLVEWARARRTGAVVASGR